MARNKGVQAPILAISLIMDEDYLRHISGKISNKLSYIKVVNELGMNYLEKETWTQKL